ncbi:MAG: DUF4129 domain-containing protein, partial [Thermomicrobiales bacterium]|nr:DUF4129 domain-containing protein [Thermomicrobiales bacterium]
RSGGWRGVPDRYEFLLRGFFSSLDSGDRFDADVAIFAIGLMMWLVGYSASWMLFRRGWVFWSLAIPGAVLLTTLALDRDRAGWPALAYLGIAFAIAAGQTAQIRARTWQLHGIEQPRTLGRRSIVLGSIIAAIAVGVGLYDSFDLDDRFRQQAVESGDRIASWVSDTLDRSGQPGSTPELASGNYGSFDDQFKVGEGIPSGDSPVAVVQSGSREYLAARRLNEYDGSGWLSTIGLTGDEISSPAPRIEFRADQPMNIPRSQIEHRAESHASIVLLQPSGRLLFTIDQHFSTSAPSLVRVGWEAIEETYIVDSINPIEMPVDLRDLMILLQSASFTAPDSGDKPEFTSASSAEAFAEIQTRLTQSYPVRADLGWTDDGRVQVHVSGRLPVYSDVEAVYSSADLGGASYSVTGLLPLVSAGELAAAGTDYPPYISSTYLHLPDTVTQETFDLANQIVQQAGATTAYEQALAIQNYLRANFTYQIDAGPAPNGRDIVDYFLFDSQIGRCDHYASSMAVMLRMLGVPARIVTGFAPVPFDSDMNGYVYRGRNAHAWVEVYFPDYGWIAFEPTPSEDPIELGETGTPDRSTPEPTVEPTQTAVPQGTEIVRTPAVTPTGTPLPAPAAIDTDQPASSDGSPSLWRYGLGAAAVGLLALLSLVFWRRHARFSGMPVAHANYGRLQRLGRFIGVAPSPQKTPREYAAEFARAKPRSADGAMRVAEAYTWEQYATNIDAREIAVESEHGWKDARRGASDWRIWRRR